MHDNILLMFDCRSDPVVFISPWLTLLWMQMTDSPSSRYFFPGDLFIWNLLKWTAPTDCQPCDDDVIVVVEAAAWLELRTLLAVLGTGDAGVWRIDRGAESFEGIVVVVAAADEDVVQSVGGSLLTVFARNKELSFEWAEFKFLARVLFSPSTLEMNWKLMPCWMK